MKTSVFRVARRIWWLLPPAARDRLRPLLLPAAGLRASVSARVRQAVGQSSASWQRHAPTRHSAVVRPLRPFPSVPETVSVIVPTLNGGPLFHRVLASVRAQTGVAGLEVVVVDSGSTDGSRELAAEAGARIFDVEPGAFGHGRTRNMAAEAATGDVLVMMVQDAVLLAPTTLRALVLELRERPSIAAVSARQIARADADLYAAFVVWAHTRAIWGMPDATARGKATTPMQRRAAASVDNVCAAFRRAAWEALPFSDVAFGEDLDFGLRAVEHGWELRLSWAAAVAHSHSRDAAYHLRRAVVDRLYVAPLVGDDRLDRAAMYGAADVVAAGRRLAREMQAALAALPGVDASLGEHLRALRSALAARPRPTEPAGELGVLASALAVLEDDAAGDGALDVLRADLLTVLAWDLVYAFARAHRVVAADAFATFTAKLTAAALGRALGDTARRDGYAAWVQPLVRGV